MRMRALISFVAAFALTACGSRDDVTEIQLQRVFG